jgi:hypothetical protein
MCSYKNILQNNKIQIILSLIFFSRLYDKVSQLVIIEECFVNINFLKRLEHTKEVMKKSLLRRFANVYSGPNVIKRFCP